jgi:hypothetical protein
VCIFRTASRDNESIENVRANNLKQGESISLFLKESRGFNSCECRAGHLVRVGVMLFFLERIVNEGGAYRIAYVAVKNFRN